MKNAVKNNEQFIRNENRVNEVMKNRRFYLAEQLKYQSRNLSNHPCSVPDTKSITRCLKLKSLIKHCERSQLRLHFEWIKVNQKCQKLVDFDEFFKT